MPQNRFSLLTLFRAVLRRGLRMSTLARALWLVLAALHAALVLRRVTTGELGSLADAVRGALCLGGVIYCSLKFWKIATVLDAAPRRALAFAMVLLLGHWLLAAPPADRPLDSSGPLSVAVLMVVPVLGAGLILASRGGSARVERRQATTPKLFLCVSEILPVAVSPRTFALLRRPPPFSL